VETKQDTPNESRSGQTPVSVQQCASLSWPIREWRS